VLTSEKNLGPLKFLPGQTKGLLQRKKVEGLVQSALLLVDLCLFRAFF
jgi:hypothetical protein